MKLSEALEGVTLEIVGPRAYPTHVLADEEAAMMLAEWSVMLCLWWQRSPMSIRECDHCGENSVAGTGTKRKCWMCGEGQMIPLKPVFTKKRPRGKKVDLP